MINVVIYGAFMWVLLKSYSDIIKSELLNDVKEIWGGKFIAIFTCLFC